MAADDHIRSESLPFAGGVQVKGREGEGWVES